jgi:RNA polymerase sigma-70 factor (ECF subfamily)
MAETAAYADDRLLVARCLAGERAAERELFRRERGRVHATLFRVLGGNRDMDDLLQEAFLEVFRSLPRWRAEARLSTWIDRIAVRVAYRHMSARRAGTTALDLVPEPIAPGPLPDARAHAREGVRRLYDALARLSPAARLAFALHVIDGRTLVEVAHLVGSTLVATKVRVWRAHRELARLAAQDPVLAQYLEEGRRGAAGERGAPNDADEGEGGAHD